MEVLATQSHSFVTLSADGLELVPIRAVDMVPGKTMLPVIRTPASFDACPRDLELVSSHGHSKLVVSLDMTFGKLVGLYLAEGCVIYRNGLPHSVSIAAIEKEHIDFVQNWGKLHSLRCTYTFNVTERGRSGSVLIGSSAVANWLSKYGRYAWGKRLPDEVWTAPRDFAEGVLSGYFSGDGTAGDQEYTAATTSRLLADGLCCLLGCLGVRATFRKHVSNSPLAKHAVYLIHPYREFLGSMPAPILSRKAEALEKLQLLPIKFSRDRIPVPAVYWAAVSKILGHQMPSSGYVSRALLKAGRELLPEAVRALVDAPLWWDVVDSVEPADYEPWVYDLDMRPLANFAVSSGLVVHNSFEDAMVISESAAKKLTTERLYAIDKEARHGVQISRNRFISAFPAKYTKDQIANMDEHGVARPGTVVNKGDPIVLAVGPKALSTADAELGRLHKALRNAFRDEALEWEYSTPGVVTDVGRTTTGVKVNVKADRKSVV
jgi:hypothetical protein